jgi:hypothetical protein
LKLRLPPRKVLGGNDYDYEVSTAPSSRDYFQKPCKFDFDYKHLAGSKTSRCLDASTLPLGKRLEMGVDPQRELDRLDKQLFEWNLKQESKNFKDEDLDKAYSKVSLIPHEYKNRNDLKTDYLM